MEYTPDPELWARYFGGSASNEEKRHIERWIGEEPLRREAVETLEALWNAARQDVEAWDVERAWERTLSSILSEAAGPDEQDSPPRRMARLRDPVPSPRHVGHASRTSIVGRLARTAWIPVALLAGLVAVLFVYQGGHEQAAVGDPQLMRTYATESGQQSEIRLPDGTRVRLHVASSLRVPPTYAVTDREVLLDGAAFFDVASDTMMPFIVRGDRGVVTVVGTEFVMSSYPDEPVHIAVSEGSVSLSSVDGPSSEPAILGANDVAVLEGNFWHVRHDSDALKRYVGWVESRLVFENTGFEAVTRQLERWYGIDIESSIAPSRVEHLTATFSDEPVEETLYVIARALHLRYEIRGHNVRFYSDGERDAAPPFDGPFTEE